MKWNKGLNKLLLFCFFGLMMSGCSRKDAQRLLEMSREEYTYTVSEKTSGIAVDNDGLLYTISSKAPEAESGIMLESGQPEPVIRYQHTIGLYDTEGNRIRQEELCFASGPVLLVTWENEKLYCVALQDSKPYVYTVDTTTWEVKTLSALPEFQLFTQMVFVREYLYVLGTMGENEKSFVLHPDVWMFTYHGEQICRVNVTEENPTVQKMKIDFPIGIYATERDTLMIYCYTEKKGFGFLEFHPAESSLREIAWSHGGVARNKVSSCGKGFFYTDGLGYLFYGTSDGVQVQLLPETIRLLKPVVYEGGFAFLLDAEHMGTVKRICVADIVQENRVLRVLTDDSPNDFPFGCGYRMTTISTTENEFALKVLAGDTDFDLFVLDTRNDCAYNLKENGAFYSLNKVEGVEEYLDACFPYIKELAYNKDGDIWMIPIDIDIPGIVYNREFCKKQGVDYASMNYMEFMELIEKAEAEEPEKLQISIGTILEPMLMQYVSKYDSFDTEMFRRHISKLKQIYQDAVTWGNTSVYGYSLGNGVPVDFYLDFEYNSEGFQRMAENVTASWAYAPIGFPKLEEGIRDVGTVTLLAVNPKSDNKKAALKYITEYCRYMLTVKNSFVLSDESTYDMENAFVRDLYQMMAGGAIEFRMSDEVYTNTFWNYLGDKIGLEEAIAEADRKKKIYQGE